MNDYMAVQRWIIWLKTKCCFTMDSATSTFIQNCLVYLSNRCLLQIYQHLYIATAPPLYLKIKTFICGDFIINCIVVGIVVIVCGSVPCVCVYSGLYYVCCRIMKHSLMTLPIPLHSLLACSYRPTILLSTRHTGFSFTCTEQFFIIDFLAKSYRKNKYFEQFNSVTLQIPF